MPPGGPQASRKRSLRPPNKGDPAGQAGPRRRSRRAGPGRGGRRESLPSPVTRHIVIARGTRPAGRSLTVMLGFIVMLLVVGLIVGAIARLLMPGRDPVGLLGTIALGVAGSFVGGFLQNLVEFHSLSVHSFHSTGIIGSVIGAWVLLLVLRLTGLEPGRRRY